MNAVVQFQPAVENYGNRSLTAADVRAQVNLMQDVMQEVMKDGTHYGKIPGTQSKSLYKAGAEKLMATFRLAAKPEVEDLSENGEIAYRVTVSLLTANGTFVGAGIGECSSAEEKYSWRAAVHKKEWDATPENRRRVKYYRDGKEVQQVLPIDGNNLVALNLPLLGEQKIATEYEAYEVEIASLLGHIEPLFFADAKVKKIAWLPIEGGSISMSLTVSVQIDEEDDAPLLAAWRRGEAKLSLVPPKAQAVGDTLDQQDAEAAAAEAKRLVEAGKQAA